MNSGIFICAEYDLIACRTGELQLVMPLEVELERNVQGGGTIEVNKKDYILWNRQMHKGQVVSYQLMALGE